VRMLGIASPRSLSPNIATSATLHAGQPIWVSLSVQDDQADLLRGGEKLLDALEALAPVPRSAVLINCCSPRAVSKAIAQVLAHPCTEGTLSTCLACLARNTLKGIKLVLIGLTCHCSLQVRTYR
jgi:Homocysteine S-methyltransferase